MFLKVNATKTKVVRPMRSKYLGFTFLKNSGEWKVKPTAEKKKKLKILGIIVTVLGVLAILTCLGVHYPWLTIGIPAIPSLYFDWFSGCIQAFIFCTLTTLFIKQAAG